jgi:hypothetical protein
MVAGGGSTDHKPPRRAPATDRVSQGRGAWRLQEKLTLDQSKPSADPDWNNQGSPKRIRPPLIPPKRPLNAPNAPESPAFLKAMFFFREADKASVAPFGPARRPMTVPPAGMPPAGMPRERDAYPVSVSRMVPPIMPPPRMPPPGMPPAKERLPPPSLGSSVASQMEPLPPPSLGGSVASKIRQVGPVAPHGRQAGPAAPDGLPIPSESPQRRQKRTPSKEDALWSRRVEMQW